MSTTVTLGSYVCPGCFLVSMVCQGRGSRAGRPGGFLEEVEPFLSHLLEHVSGSREGLRTPPGDLGPLGTTCAVSLAWE